MNNMGKQINSSHLWMNSVGFVWRQSEIVTYQLKKKWIFIALLTRKIQNWSCPTDTYSNYTVFMKSFYNQRKWENITMSTMQIIVIIEGWILSL